MTKKYTRYEKDFKLEASKLVTEHGYSCAEASRRLGLPNHLVGSWLKALKKSGDLPADEVLSSAGADLKALREENAKLRMENEILKKATAYFAKDIL
jgi:transposase-like protein